jgi:O-6-methylguanine DNA methyltransferase
MIQDNNKPEPQIWLEDEVLEKIPDTINKALDQLFADGPSQTATLKAQANLRQALEVVKSKTIYFGDLHHPFIGKIYVAVRDGKLLAVAFGEAETDFISAIEKKFSSPLYPSAEETATVRDQVRQYLQGKRTAFSLEVDLSPLTDFQRQVLIATQGIPRGEIATYAEIARKIGKPKAVRAVGQALGRNPVPIVIPCHRVIAADGSLGGYSGGGGVETKARLLQLEGVRLPG